MSQVTFGMADLIYLSLGCCPGLGVSAAADLVFTGEFAHERLWWPPVRRLGLLPVTPP